MCGISALILGVASCMTQKKESGVLASSQNYPGLEGVYTSVVPCADCEGIRTVLKLSEDGSYEMKQTYLGKGDEPFVTKNSDMSGKFSFDNDKGIVTVGEGENQVKYLVGDKMLTMLDRQGNKIEGEHADMYVFAKVDADLVEKRWKLTELMGEKVETPQNGKEAFIILHTEGARVNGNFGCNDFSGSYELKPGNRLYFNQLVGTQKMCLSNMEIESAFKEALDRVDSYVINGDVLILNRARMAPLAKFEAVYLQ